MKSKTLGIHWFRRDLRLNANPALKFNFEKNDGRVLGLFCFDSTFLSRQDFSHHRFAFFLDSLKALQKDMKSCGGDLLILDQLPDLAFRQILKDHEVKTVSWNRDYEPFARERDQKIKSLLTQDFKVEILTERDHLVIEPHEITKKPAPLKKNYYQVYSPFAKKWYDLLQTKEISDRVSAQKQNFDELKNLKEHFHFRIKWKDISKNPPPDQLENFIKQNSKSVKIQIPRAGTQAAYEKLKEFATKISDYGESRNYPNEAGTSQFSIYFKNGTLTTAQVIYFLKLQKLNYASDSGANKFLKELVWREFYYSILYHEPKVEHLAFREKYAEIKWQNDPKLFKSWCEGKTGYPIVDAGMRQLNTTGWMHNRVRMIVASFLTKDLLIDWRWGENYFMKMLLDGDLAPNNGGWQWAASTGCDPQPYFRIFNPLLQSQKFDPEGHYIRKFVPELRGLDSKKIHAPDRHGGAKDYPSPIVNHQEQKAKALKLYRSLK